MYHHPTRKSHVIISVTMVTIFEDFFSFFPISKQKYTHVSTLVVWEDVKDEFGFHLMSLMHKVNEILYVFLVKIAN